MMKRCFSRILINKRSVLLTLTATVVLSGCTLGPNFQQPKTDTPADWISWRSGDVSLHTTAGAKSMADNRWWERYNDPVLDGLVVRALSASPDIKTAALRFFSARAQHRITTSSQTPDVNATGKVNREQTSENNLSTRVLKEVIAQPDELVDLMTEPYTWYQAGLDFSWEIDLWGRVRRAVEASSADLTAQREMLELAKLSIVGDVVNNYYTLRNIQQQIVLAKEDAHSMAERLSLIRARTEGGELDYINVERQQSELSAARVILINLQRQEGIVMNQLLLLLGERPGTLQEQLTYNSSSLNKVSLPSLSLGIPSEVALTRPDIRAAEARLHAATARIGVAKAELYPSIRLGARIGFDSYSESNFAEWKNRIWSVGPSLNLPLFDRGRRKATVVLRELDQQQAAIDYHKTVLKAWQEIDNSLSSYAAAQQKLIEQEQRVQNAKEAQALIYARYDGGLISFINVLDSQRSYIQARQSLAISQRDVRTAWAAVNRAVGNYPR